LGKFVDREASNESANLGDARVALDLEQLSGAVGVEVRNPIEPSFCIDAHRTELQHREFDAITANPALPEDDRTR
jgi:hypothetical protein